MYGWAFLRRDGVHAHANATELFDNAVVLDGLPEK